MIIYKPSPSGRVKIFEGYDSLSNIADIGDMTAILSLRGNFSENDVIAAYQKVLIYPTIYMAILLSRVGCIFINAHGGQYSSIGSDLQLANYWAGTSIRPKYKVEPDQVGVGFINTKLDILQICKRPSHLFKDIHTGNATDGIDVYNDIKVEYTPPKSCPMSMYNEMKRLGHTMCIETPKGVVYYS